MKLSNKPLKVLTGHHTALSIFAISAAFITYCSMYAFRKPFLASTYAEMSLWGIDYKIILISTQVLGYMLSKFIGIRVISEMQPERRLITVAILIGVAWVSLLLFGLTPFPYNFIWLFMNGLPLGLIWGLVFSFLEGRRNTELLGAGMSASFIVASGLVKSVGKYLLDHWHVSDFWMPFLTGLLFVPFLLLGIWMLSKIPPPDALDKMQRTERVPMKKVQRWAFFREFSTGIVFLVIIYIALTIFRDIRDSFAVEIWSLLGYSDSARILFTAEIYIAVAVFALVALMIFIKNNRKAFFGNIGIIMLGGFLLMATTFLFQKGMLPPAIWMIMVGFAMYLSYISYHTMLFERWIALFRYQSNIGFLMYIADAFGYLGSVGILFYKNFGTKSVNWLDYIVYISYIVGAVTIVLSIFAWRYFHGKEKRLTATRVTG